MSVHSTHCCKVHGCKYDDKDCPVFEGPDPGIICEFCDTFATDETNADLQWRPISECKDMHRMAVFIAVNVEGQPSEPWISYLLLSGMWTHNATHFCYINPPKDRK